MNLEKLTIEGYKSIGKIEIVKPNPFTVFVGPNASGKSNIFEAIELLELSDIMNPNEAKKLFGSTNDIFNQATTLSECKQIRVEACLMSTFDPPTILAYPNINLHLVIPNKSPFFPSYGIGDTLTDMTIPARENIDCKHFLNFTRLFVGQPSRLTRQDDSRLNTDCSNLEKVLKRILKDENKREGIHEILQALIPGFERVEIVSSELSGKDDLIVYETYLKKPLTKEFISDGTYNLIAMITALYQSDTPQFLCIEEPENGVNPMVVRELVSIFRNRCKEEGHYIWLNTHSQSLVSELTTEEIVIVEKVEGLTQIKQIQGMNLFGFKMDDALYTNVIGGGNPW